MHLVTQFGRHYAYCYYFDAKTGKRRRIRRSTGIRDDGTASSRKRAEIVAAEIERSLALGHNRVARPETLEDAFRTLIQKRELAGAPKATIDITLWKGKAIVEFFGPKRRAESLTTDDLERYARERKATPNTIRREFSELRQAFKAIKLDLPPTPDLAPSRPRERWLTPEECIRLLTAVQPSRRDYVLAYLQLGVRKSELERIMLEDVFRLSDGNWAVRVRGTKTKASDRVIPLTDTAFGVVQSRLHATVSGPLFPHWTNADRDLRDAALKAKLGRLSFNDLRRTFATQLAIAGVPILHLKALMGHSSTRMLETVYARVGGEHVVQSVKSLPSLQPHQPLSNEGKGGLKLIK